MRKNEKTIFLSYAEKKAGAHFEFWYSSCKEHALFVPLDMDQIFFKEYLKYLEPTKTPNGGTKFDGCGINYYTKEQAKTMYEEILADKPLEYTGLAAWLALYVSSSAEPGFYILGV